jgi:hypothetical protein
LNVSSFSNWTTRFQRKASGNSSSPELTFFKAVAQYAALTDGNETEIAICQIKSRFLHLTLVKLEDPAVPEHRPNSL